MVLGQIKNVVAYWPAIKDTREWDYDFLLSLLRFKLERMAETIESNAMVACAKKQARQMRLVMAHIDRFRNASDFYPYEGPEPAAWVSEAGIFQSTEEHREWAAYVSLREDHHWEKIWKLVSKYGRGWWD